MKVNNFERIKGYYEKVDVVSDYMKKRFTKPIYFVEHKLQVELVNQALKEYNPKKVLEIAPGPARLTTELCIDEGIALDHSPEMLKLAERRIKQVDKNWKFIRGDAFHLPFRKSSFDFLLTFRFIRHFEKPDRIKLYQEFKRLLKNNGILVFEAINHKKAALIRRMVGIEKYKIYDKLYTEEELLGELEKNGFDVLKLEGVINHFFIEMIVSKISSFIGLNNFGKRIIMLLERTKGRNPLGWVVICRKK